MALVLSVLLRSGMDFLQAIKLTEENAKNRCMRRTLGECRLAIERGQDIGRVLSQSFWIPLVVVQVFAMGQASGHLDQLLAKLAEDYDSQVEAMVARLSGLLEPILIILLSLMIGFVVFATFLPILESGDLVWCVPQVGLPSARL